ncbi:MAG: hypothetical protein NC308_04255, partial [Clostridium sp.]|nr:hypothetical protein [Clostridium sp.]
RLQGTPCPQIHFTSIEEIAGHKHDYNGRIANEDTRWPTGPVVIFTNLSFCLSFSISEIYGSRPGLQVPASHP